MNDDITPAPEVNPNATDTREKTRRSDHLAELETLLPMLDEEFALLRDTSGVRVYNVNERREARLLTDKELSLLYKSADTVLTTAYGRTVDKKVVSTLMELWLRRTTNTLDADPLPFQFKGNDICFKRLDWEPSPGEHPAWDEFVSRTSDPKAFMAFVWACFDPDHKGRQYLWLRGDGQDGKSTVVAVLGTVLGSAFTTVDDPDFKGDNTNHFLAAKLYGKRVAANMDSKNAKLGMSGLLRRVTSGDFVTIEFKYMPAFAARLRLKLFICCNDPPEITSSKADTSRLIHIEVAASKCTDDSTFETKLTDQLPAFLDSCRKAYKEVCPNGGDIKLNEESKALLERASTVFEDDHASLFETYMVQDNKAISSGAAMLAVLKGERLTNIQIANFKSWMIRNRGVEVSTRGGRVVYKGVRLLSWEERSEAAATGVLTLVPGIIN